MGLYYSIVLIGVIALVGKRLEVDINTIFLSISIIAAAGIISVSGE
jgi:hypothetical protein